MFCSSDMFGFAPWQQHGDAGGLQRSPFPVYEGSCGGAEGSRCGELSDGLSPRLPADGRLVLSGPAHGLHDRRYDRCGIAKRLVVAQETYLAVNELLCVSGERDELDPRAVIIADLPAPHQYAAAVSANAVTEPYETGVDPCLRFDPDAVHADVLQGGDVVLPRKVLEGDDAHRTFPLYSQRIPVCLTQFVPLIDAGNIITGSHGCACPTEERGIITDQEYFKYTIIRPSGAGPFTNPGASAFPAACCWVSERLE